MKKTLVFASVLVSSALAFAAGTSVIKISRLSDTQAAISCKNGADPTGRKEGDVVIISCGTR